ncbi:MAG: hypothetical protein H6711_23830 [Myxococcales bacterium]|nr:hypothetical protein [Myxococcales bacterium]
MGSRWSTAALLALALDALAACAPPITCPPGHDALRQEIACPPCGPDQSCECVRTTTWTCRPSPELAAERRDASQREADERLAREREAARADALAAARQELLERNAARFMEALERQRRGEADPRCGADGYLVLREEGVNATGDGLVTGEVCQELPRPAAAIARDPEHAGEEEPKDPKAPKDPKDRGAGADQAPPPAADLEAALAAARALCKRAKPARCDKEAREGHYACRRDDASLPDHGAAFTCDELTPPPPGCTTEWVPALAACPRPGCRAGADECCQEDGTIVRPCYQTGAPGCTASATCRGAGGWCYRCRCLPPTAMIAAPDGDRPIEALAIGDRIYTVDRAGLPIVAPIVALRRLDVLGEHEVVRLTLDDGRELLASGPHPDAGGRPIAALAVGDPLSGGRVIERALVPHGDAPLWDLRPAGETGLYFVGGVLLGSTIDPGALDDE